MYIKLMGDQEMLFQLISFDSVIVFKSGFGSLSLSATDLFLHKHCKKRSVAVPQDVPVQLQYSFVRDANIALMTNYIIL